MTLEFDHLIGKKDTFTAYISNKSLDNARGGVILTDVCMEASGLPFRDHLHSRRSKIFDLIPVGSWVRFTGKINRYPAEMPEPGQEFCGEYKYEITSIKNLEVLDSD